MKTTGEIRRENMLIAQQKAGGVKELAEKANVSEGYMSQIKNRAPDSKTKRPMQMGHAVARRIEDAIGEQLGWMDQDHSLDGIEYQSVAEIFDQDDSPKISRIRKVTLRLSAGIAGFAVEPDPEDDCQAILPTSWITARGYKVKNLIALSVKGESMEPSLTAGDIVVIDTADTTPKDGAVFAINYEGEAIVKRMVRDSGAWWLSSDNPDKRRFPLKQCSGDSCILIGQVIHKQSERI